jgi:hypothetical protein
VIAVVTALMIAAAVSTPGSAGAAPGLTFDLELGGPCFRGVAPAGRSVELVLKAPDGATRAFTHAHAGGLGKYTTCFDVDIHGGDILVAHAGDLSRRWVVPRSTVRVDRVTDVVSGDAPAGSSVHVTVRQGPNFFGSPGHAEADVTAGPHGRYAIDFSSQLDIGAGMAGVITIQAAGDTLRLVGYSLWVVTERGANTIYGIASGPVDLELRAADGHLRAEARATDRYGQFLIYLVDAHGSPTYPRAGDTIVVAQDADAHLLIPAGRLNGDPDANVLFGRCMPNAPFDLGVSHDDSGTADETGHFRKDQSEHRSVKTGQFIEVYCHYPTGDIYQIYNYVH